jgi:hypothetical protein
MMPVSLLQFYGGLDLSRPHNHFHASPGPNGPRVAIWPMAFRSVASCRFSTRYDPSRNVHAGDIFWKCRTRRNVAQRPQE